MQRNEDQPKVHVRYKDANEKTKLDRNLPLLVQFMSRAGPKQRTCLTDHRSVLPETDMGPMWCPKCACIGSQTISNSHARHVSLVQCTARACRGYGSGSGGRKASIPATILQPTYEQKFSCSACNNTDMLSGSRAATALDDIIISVSAYTRARRKGLPAHERLGISKLSGSHLIRGRGQIREIVPRLRGRLLTPTQRQAEPAPGRRQDACCASH